ncbi:adenylyl-sulfate kinase [Gilvimarinus agarilyticus]|uniref:adenylyl-sulfate kinase n=1 Tax=Gilvimarinus agarilyticus TaxID=679259 RepID=UPI0005A2559C|nr:adenylyl-sulfate kinase [Gilvimarinus agarilyticus]
MDKSKSSHPYELKDITLPSNAVWHKSTVCPAERAASMGQTPRCIWLTGLSGSGKSTVANALDATLHANGFNSFLLDGDNVRHGLNKDLGMTESDRAENIRRVGEVAKLMVESGLIVICAFISPYKRDRQMVRSMFKPGEFVEVFLDTPLSVCEKRDPKGLYKKARAGVIKQFTGVSDPYEQPESAELILNTTDITVTQGVESILNVL